MNTPQNPTRITLTSLDDVAALDLAPELLAAVREQFTAIWEATPHKIDVLHVQSVLGDPAFLLWSFGEETALYSDPNASATFPVHYGCFPYIRVIWHVDIDAEGHLTFTPELEHTLHHGTIDFTSIMGAIDPSLVAFSPISWEVTVVMIVYSE